MTKHKQAIDHAKLSEHITLPEVARRICLREKSEGRELNITDASRAVRHFLDIVAEDPKGLDTVESWIKARRMEAEEGSKK